MGLLLDLLPLIALTIIMAPLTVAIIALVRLKRLSEELNWKLRRLERRLEEGEAFPKLEQRIRELEKKMESQPAKISQPSAESKSILASEATVQLPTHLVVAEKALDSTLESKIASSKVDLPFTPVKPAALQAATPPYQRRISPELEALIGGNWLLKIGIVAIVLGLLYFLKYAFDNQWIGNTGRVLIGVLAGLGLLYGGEIFQKKDYKIYGQTLAGGGISILYLSIYAAFNFYGLIPQVPALLLMVLVTAVCNLLSAHHFSKTLAVLGLLGGMLTPYWLSTGKSNQIGLLVYLLILDFGVGFLARYRNWFFLNSLSFVGTFILFLGWAGRFYTREALWTTEIFLILFAALYVFLAEGMRAQLERARSSNANLSGVFTAVVVVLLFISSQAVLAHNAKYYWGFLLIFDGLALAASLRVKPKEIAAGVFILNVLGIWAWIIASYHPSDRAVVWGCLSGLFALFLMQSILRWKLTRAPMDSWDVSIGLGTGLGYFALSYYLLADDYLGWMGLFALALALVHLLAARSVSAISTKAQPLTLSFIAVSVTLMTLAIPIQFRQNWITLGWAAESVLLIWIGFATRSIRLRQAALVVLSLSLLRLLAWDRVQHIPDYILIFNSRVFTFLALVAAIYLIALFYRRHLSEAEYWERPLYNGLILLASGVSVLLVSQESWVYHDDKIRQLYLSLGREELEEAQYGWLSGRVRNNQQLVLTLLWGSYSIAAVVIGILRRYPPIRLFGIALFFLAILKVFFLDIWSMQQLYRIICVIGLECLLLVVAFLYQRFKKLIFEW